MHLGAEGQQAILAQDRVHEEPQGGLRAGALSSGARTRRVQRGDKDGDLSESVMEFSWGNLSKECWLIVIS